MTPIDYGGGIHLSVEIRLDANRIAAMRPEVIRALCDGIAKIVYAQQLAQQEAKV